MHDQNQVFKQEFGFVFLLAKTLREKNTWKLKLKKNRKYYKKKRSNNTLRVIKGNNKRKIFAEDCVV
nr:hypothetical protein [Vibrio vulnificus]